MSPSVIMYIGFIIAIFILSWGGTTLYQRYRGHSRGRKIVARSIDTWVPLKPTVTDTVEELAEELATVEYDQEEDTSQHSKAQQNGHYSERKPIL